MKSNLIIDILIPILTELGLIKIAIFVSSNFITKGYFTYIKIVEVSFNKTFQEFPYVQGQYLCKERIVCIFFQ